VPSAHPDRRDLASGSDSRALHRLQPTLAPQPAATGRWLATVGPGSRARRLQSCTRCAAACWAPLPPPPPLRRRCWTEALLVACCAPSSGTSAVTGCSSQVTTPGACRAVAAAAVASHPYQPAAMPRRALALQQLSCLDRSCSPAVWPSDPCCRLEHPGGNHTSNRSRCSTAGQSHR
jgi:hypothetical protein